MSDSDFFSRVAIMHRLAGGWDALLALFGLGAGSGLLAIITRAQGLSQAEVLTWVGLVSTIAGLVSSGLLVFYRKASRTLLEDAKEWDTYRGATWEAKAKSWEATAVREAAEHEETKVELKLAKVEIVELRAALGDAYDRIERLLMDSKQPSRVTRPKIAEPPKDDTGK